MQEPFRVGIAGSRPQGQGLLERLIVRPHSDVVLYEPEGTGDSLSRPPGLLTTTDWHRFLTGMELDSVLFLDGRSLDRSQIESALDAGLPIGILPPLSQSALTWPELQSPSPNLIRLLNPHREEADFLAVRGWLQSRPLEAYSAIKRISWVADLIETNTPPRPADDGWFSEWLWEDLDQLLVLTAELPALVYAAEFSEQRQCYSLNLRFSAGVSAHLERRRSSLVPLDLGWTVSSGYAHGRQYVRTDAGEIYDVPVDSPDRGIDPLAVFDGPIDPENSWSHAMGVLKVQHAILESAASGQVILMSD